VNIQASSFRRNLLRVNSSKNRPKTLRFQDGIPQLERIWGSIFR
jgi:hypothetical protein